MSDTADVDAIRNVLMRALTGTQTAASLKAANPELADKAIRADGTVDWKHVNSGIEYAGKKITLPAEPSEMPIPEAIKVLQDKAKEQDTVVSVHEVIDASPLDGAVAFAKALQRIYGWANSVPTPGFFGPKPPQMLTVDVGPGPADKIQVPWGGFQIPGVENPIHTAVTNTPRGAAFVIYGEVRKKYVDTLKRIAALTREIVKTESIYRGKAIRLRAASESTSDLNNPPEFIDLSAARGAELVLPETVEALIRTNIWTLVEKTEQCRKAKIPLKRGVLLSGKYGVGKTLCSLLTADKCVANGWTFISLDRAQALHQALEFAKRYEPCVIFAEDIDRAANERNEATNDLLNIMDGVLSKNSQIMVVMTTNHIERINQAMLRPGRLDAVITLLPPDKAAAERLLRIYGNGLIDAKEDLGGVAEELAGNIPALIREVVERSKLAAISLGQKRVTQDGLMIAVEGMKQHMALLADPTTKEPSPEERLGRALADVVGARVQAQLAKSTSILMEVLDTHDEIAPDAVIDDAEVGSEYRERVENLLAKVKGVNGSGKQAAVS